MGTFQSPKSAMNSETITKIFDCHLMIEHNLDVIIDPKITTTVSL